MRWLYSSLLYLATPAVLLRLLWRSIRLPDYRRRWCERFGYSAVRHAPYGIWIHAVSVGEVQASVPLVRSLISRYPDLPVLLTTHTPTGSTHVQRELGDQVDHCYLPYDLPGAVERFLSRVQPRIAIIMETELWPNLYQACASKGIPLILANARLSQRSFQGYRRISGIIKQCLNQVTWICAQSEDDAQRFAALGAPRSRIRITGSLKFDLEIDPELADKALQLRSQWGTSRPIWIAASTHAGEEEQILEAHRRIRAQQADCLLVLVPRHPDRFAAVATLLEQAEIRWASRTSNNPVTTETEVLLGDTMGELLLLYAASDVAFVGGSLVPEGGHNILEPAALGMPVVFGPHRFNFHAAGQLLLDNAAAYQVENATHLAQTTARLLRDREARDTAGQKGRRVVEQNRGALEKLLQTVEQTLSEVG